MTEYIEREKAIKPICEACNKQFPEEPCEPSDCTIMQILRSIPAANVRPVVTCRDCKWTKTGGMDDPAIYCMQWDRWEVPPDGFCWLGEKREES